MLVGEKNEILLSWLKGDYVDVVQSDIDLLIYIGDMCMQGQKQN
jgi:serine phosphatase RsbU (regulator of sigma subunit)